MDRNKVVYQITLNDPVPMQKNGKNLKNSNDFGFNFVKLRLEEWDDDKNALIMVFHSRQQLNFYQTQPHLPFDQLEKKKRNPTFFFKKKSR